MAYLSALNVAGVFMGGAGLQPPATATTLRRGPRLASAVACFRGPPGRAFAELPWFVNTGGGSVAGAF